MKDTDISRKEITPAFITSVICITILFTAMYFIQKSMLMSNAYINGFGDFFAGCIAGNWFNKFEWILADFTEATFLACPIASVLMIVGTFIAWHLEKTNSPGKGTGVSGLSGIFVPLFFVSGIAMILGTLLYGSFFATGWIPTFAAFLAVNGFICYYGTDLKKMITILVYSVVVTFFVNMAILKYIVSPLGLPLFISVSITIFIVCPLGTFLFGMMPWMKIEPAPAGEASSEEAPAAVEISPSKWFYTQIFGDVGSLMVWGSSIGAIFMYAGAIIAWILNPLNPDYGSGSFPTLLFAQLMTAALAIYIYYPVWKKDGMALTFASIVFVSAILTTYPNHPVIVILTIIVAAIVEQPVEAFVLKLLFRGQSHPIPFIQLGIFTVTTVWAFIVKLVLMPLLGL